MANVFWRGGAPAVKQVVTLTFTGIWAAADTYRFTIGTKDLTLTIGADITVAGIATEFKETFAASDPLTPTPSSGYVRSSGGQQIPEFVGVVATNPSAGVVVLTGIAGIPFDYTSAATTVGTGDVTAATTIAATGPNFLSNPDNYLGGVAPTTGDTLIFDSGEVSASYALDFLRAGSFECDVKIYGDWRGTLGLPPINAAGYPEYRTRYFQWQTNPSTLEILPSSSGFVEQGSLYIDMQDCPGSTVRVLAGRGSGASPTIFFAGGDTTVGLVEFTVERGNVYVEPPDSPAASSKRFFADVVRIGTPGGVVGDTLVYFGSTARLSELAAGGLFQYSGRVYNDCSMIVGAEEAPLTIEGGEHYLTAGNASHQNIDIRFGASMFMNGNGSLENIDCAGVWDQRNGSGSLTYVGTFFLYKGASLFAAGNRGTPAFKTVSCGIHDLAALQTAADLTWTPS